MRRASRTIDDSLSRLHSGKECHNNPIVIGWNGRAPCELDLPPLIKTVHTAATLALALARQQRWVDQQHEART
jgi:hypothetical protein